MTEIYAVLMINEYTLEVELLGKFHTYHGAAELVARQYDDPDSFNHDHMYPIIKATVDMVDGLTPDDLNINYNLYTKSERDSLQESHRTDVRNMGKATERKGPSATFGMTTVELFNS